MRCGLLLQMSHVAWSVCLSVSVLGTRMSCAETAEPTEMRFGRLTHAGPKNHVLAGGADLPRDGALLSRHMLLLFGVNMLNSIRDKTFNGVAIYVFKNF